MIGRDHWIESAILDWWMNKEEGSKLSWLKTNSFSDETRFSPQSFVTIYWWDEHITRGCWLTSFYIPRKATCDLYTWDNVTLWLISQGYRNWCLEGTRKCSLNTIGREDIGIEDSVASVSSSFEINTSNIEGKIKERILPDNPMVPSGHSILDGSKSFEKGSIYRLSWLSSRCICTLRGMR